MAEKSKSSEEVKAEYFVMDDTAPYFDWDELPELTPELDARLDEVRRKIDEDD